ncbi:MAG: cell division protein FtsQ/DivIB [Actinomycetota bacterium]
MSERPGRVRTDPRISRRRKAVARSKRKRLLVGVSATIAVGVLVWIMFWSPLLVVREVKVLGSPNTTSAEVAEVAGLASTDQNLLLLPTSRVEEQVETLPWVASAEVDRMLPGTVRVKIVERVPALVLSLGAARWTLDEAGNVLSGGVRDKKLPVLAGVEVGNISPGGTLKTEEARAALEVMRSLPPVVRRKVAGVFAPTTERITLSLRSGTAIRYGAPEGMDAKNEVLKALLARLESEGRRPAYVDVRVPTSPAVSDSSVGQDDGGEDPEVPPSD